MFAQFGLHAAADGLFHPASTIEAFTEHDAKYRQEIQSASAKSRSGPRRARSGSEYPPSRENHRLPALHSGKTKRDRLTARPESKLQPASNSGSAPASMTSSLSKLLGADEAKRSLSATQSDSSLYAPRRLNAVPPSADRNALDFLERELESDNDNNPHHSPVAKSSRAANELDNNEIPDDSNATVAPLDFSLARKFKELKRVMKSNREKHDSARLNSEQLCNEVPSGKSVAGQPASSSTTAQPKSSSRSDRERTKSAIRASCGGSSRAKNGGEASKVKGTLKKRSTPAARATTDMNNGSMGFKRAPANHVSGVATRKKTSASVAVAIAPPVRSKKGVNLRSGVSLSDLKAEHLEALQMLKELGGPVDPDYLQVDTDSNVSRAHQLGRSITRTVPRKSPNQLKAPISASTPPTSANSGISMVTKLRESISSGRGSSRESSPRTGTAADSPTMSSGRMDKKSDTTSMAPVSTRKSDSSPPSSNQTLMQEVTSDITTALDQAHLAEVKRDATATTGSVPDAVDRNSPSTSSTNASDPWKQYEDDTNDEDEDNNELERDGSDVRGAPTLGDRYSDEDFESDW